MEHKKPFCVPFTPAQRFGRHLFIQQALLFAFLQAISAFTASDDSLSTDAPPFVNSEPVLPASRMSPGLACYPRRTSNAHVDASPWLTLWMNEHARSAGVLCPVCSS